jgi:hypothetical protein
MKRIRELLARWRERNLPQSLMQGAARPRRKSTDGLYVVRVDFPVSSPELREGLRTSFGRLKEDYGLDFIVLEPGIHLKRFDDI